MWYKIRQLCLIIGVVSSGIVLLWPLILLCGIGVPNLYDYAFRALRFCSIALLIAPIAFTIYFTDL